MIWADIEKMIAACPEIPGAIPMVRMPDEAESSIQHATDIGALGIIMPTVDDVAKAQATVRYAKYPFEGRRSLGGGQAPRIWGVNGINYRQTANDNMLVVAMIETPTGVSNAYDIARIPGIDVLLVANTDLGNFSGYQQTDDGYQEMVKKIHDATLKAGKFVGATSPAYAEGRADSADFRMFQNGRSNDGYTPPGGAGKKGGKKKQ
jgi:2-keto-3-deoxy-L-rhamnonate aldolase RhmA